MPRVTWGTWLVTLRSIYSCVCYLYGCFVQQVPKTWVPISLRGDLLLCTSLLALWQSIVRHFYLNLQENPRKMLLLRLLETSMEKKEDPLFFSWSFNTLRKLYFEDVWCTRHCFQLCRIVMKFTPVVLACEYSRLSSPVGMFRKRDVCVSEPTSCEEWARDDCICRLWLSIFFSLKLETIILKLNGKRKRYLRVFCFLTSFSKRKIWFIYRRGFLCLLKSSFASRRSVHQT